MARATITLTATQIKQAKAKEKDYKLFDGGGLFLFITKKGSKLWRLKYRFDGKEKSLSLGQYPTITLTKARELREKYKIDISNGINPTEQKRENKAIKQQEEIKNRDTFKAIALERLSKVENDISGSHYMRSYNSLKNDVYPYIGDIPINEIIAKDIIEVLQRMMERGVSESARKVYHSISKTFKWAIANSKAIRNPASDIDVSEIIGKKVQTHYPTITDDEGIKNLLTNIKKYKGELSTKYALEMLSYTFVRPSNLRLALWEEIDFKSKRWVKSAKKMKSRDDFIIPLSDKVIELLKEIKVYSDGSPYLFPSSRSKTRPLSDGTLLGAIRKMGYTKDEFVPHGFRAMFSTIAHEKSPFSYDVIETQLAHSVGNSVSKAYNRAKYLDDRTKLMEWWSNYLDEVRK